MTPDRLQAEAFLAALTGSSETPVTFQVFNDGKKGPKKAAVHHFPLSRIWPELCWQNGSGVGVFVMVNAGDGLNRAAVNVTGLRALFIDDDQGTFDIRGQDVAALQPSIVVKSKRGLHVYWLLEEGQPLQRFSGAQEHLAAHFGTDPAVKDLPRVLRVPGFFHMKDPRDPVMVQLIEATPSRKYTIDQVLSAFPAPVGHVIAAPIRSAPRRARRPGVHLAPGEAEAVLEQLPNLGIFKWAAEHPDDVSREAWRGLATNIAAAVLDDVAAEEAGEELFQSLSAKDSARYSPADTLRTFKDALKSARNFGPMRYETLIAAGVPEEVCVGAGVAAAPVAVAKKLLTKQQRKKT